MRKIIGILAAARKKTRLDKVSGTEGWFGKTSRFGIWVLMVTFGAGFGYTVMARISLLVGRFRFLFGDWIHLID